MSVPSILNQVGGESWLKGKLAGEALSVVGGVFDLLKEAAPACYRDVIRELDYNVLADCARADNSNGLHRWLPSVPLPHRKKLLDELSSEDWRWILARSSLAAIANVLEDLKHHPLGDTGGRVARYIAEADLSAQFAEGRIGLVGRIMRSLKTLDSSAADTFGRQVAGLRCGTLKRMTSAEPPEVRLDRIGLLLFALRSVDVETARTVVGNLVDAALIREIPRTPLSKLQWFIYNVYAVDPERVRWWLLAMPNGMAMNKLVEADKLEDVVWMIWNVARVDTELAKGWNEEYLAAGEVMRLWQQADLRSRLAYHGLCHLLDLEMPMEAGGSGGSVCSVTEAVDEAPSPSYACLALYGAGVGRDENYRKKLFRSVDVRKLEENINKMREYGADAVMQKLLDAVDPCGSTSGRLGGG